MIIIFFEISKLLKENTNQIYFGILVIFGDISKYVVLDFGGISDSTYSDN